MSDEPKAAANPPKRWNPQGHDVFLAVLAGQAIAELFTFGVTLIVDGTVVSGTTIGPKEFFREFGKQIDQAWPAGDRGTAFESLFSRILSDLDNEEAQDRSVDAGWIHLKDVVILGSDGSRLNTPLWRGLLTHVGGWTMGTFDRLDPQ